MNIIPYRQQAGDLGFGQRQGINIQDSKVPWQFCRFRLKVVQVAFSRQICWGVGGGSDITRVEGINRVNGGELARTLYRPLSICLQVESQGVPAPAQQSRARICKEPRNRFPPCRGSTTTVFVVPARLAAQAGVIYSSDQIPGLLKRTQKKLRNPCYQIGLHQWHFHWGNTCLFLPPTTCCTVTVNEIKDTQFVLLI